MAIRHTREERIRAMLDDIRSWDMNDNGRADTAGEWPTRLNTLIAAGDDTGLKELEGELWAYFWQMSQEVELELQEKISHEG